VIDPRQRVDFVLMKNEGLPGRKAMLCEPHRSALIEAHDLLDVAEQRFQPLGGNARSFQKVSPVNLT